MKDVVVGGIDATQDALAAMQAGDLDVTVFQDAAGQGKGAVEAAVKLAQGRSRRAEDLGAVPARHARQYLEIFEEELSRQTNPARNEGRPAGAPRAKLRETMGGVARWPARWRQRPRAKIEPRPHPAI